tara:strand:- start:7 stop:342 length:336 start_codon:yes stop_codon:yes gene_type:complete
MAELSNLFTKTSNILRDVAILELKKNNDFLRNTYTNDDSILCKCEVTIESHTIPMSGGLIFPETKGVIIKTNDSMFTILYKDENEKYKVKCFPFNLITITDKKIDKLFDNC